MTSRPVPSWLRALQVFEYLFLLVGAGLVVTGRAPLLGVVVAVVTLVVAVLTQVLAVRLAQDAGE